MYVIFDWHLLFSKNEKKKILEERIKVKQESKKVDENEKEEESPER